MRALLLAGVVACGLAPGAQADVVFNLSDVALSTELDGAGTLTGSFTTNDALSAVVSYDIVASAFDVFAGFRYTPASAAVTASVLPSQYLQLDSATGTSELRLSFTSPLTMDGATLASPASYEYETSGGFRYATGSVVRAAAAPAAAIPEPASLALLGLGVAGLAVGRRRRAG